jgi:hypothetical protein
MAQPLLLLVEVGSVVAPLEVPLAVPLEAFAPVDEAPPLAVPLPLVVPPAPLVPVAPLEAVPPASGGVVNEHIKLVELHVAPRLWHLQFATVVHQPSMPA